MSDRIAVMNKGRVEQVGSPTEIYERPRTRFVADFIGEINILEEGGRLRALRPEKIRLVAADGARHPERLTRTRGTNRPTRIWARYRDEPRRVSGRPCATSRRSGRR